jgi:predicted O-methyltransferase YrrM
LTGPFGGDHLTPRARDGTLPPVPHWIDDRHLVVGGDVFQLEGIREPDPDATEVSILKPRRLVDRYLRLAEEFHGGRVFEAGIFRGGSTAFLTAILEPAKLVAIDIDLDRNRWLDQWLDERGMGERVRIHHGVDQADRVAIEKLLTDELAGQPLDLVIDDASHLLTPTSSTFDLLFPRLRAGGLYVIEDWSWDLLLRQSLARRPDKVAQMLTDDPGLLERAPEDRVENEVWRLVFRLATALGTNADLVPEMELSRGFAALRRGSLELDPDTFTLADWVPDPPV